MRIAVTGATGNVGSAVVDRLASEQAIDDIVAIARRAPGDGWQPSRTRFVAADVAADDLAPHLRDVDAVIHLAWLFQPTHAPMTTWRANVEGSIRVFEAAAAAGVTSLVYASSVGAYSPVPAPGALASSDGRAHCRDEPVDESWPTHSTPTAAYGREKAYVERVLDAFEARHPSVRVVRLRPAFVFQRRSSNEQRRLFAGPLVPRVVARRGLLPVVPLPRGLRFQAVHATDLADAFGRVVLSDVRGAFNIAAGPVLDADALGQVVGARPVAVPRRATRAAMALAWHLGVIPSDPALFDLAIDLPLMSTERAERELGWSPRRTAVEAAVEVVEGMAAGAGGATPPLAPDSPGGRLEEVSTGIGRA